MATKCGRDELTKKAKASSSARPAKEKKPLVKPVSDKPKEELVDLYVDEQACW
jgi:hypothetical protein